MSCVVHRTHNPQPLRTVLHHIQPLAMAGANDPANEVEICDTGHYNVHRLLGDLIRSDGAAMRKGGTHAERDLARAGWAAWVKAGKPGHPVFELEEHP